MVPLFQLPDKPSVLLASDLHLGVPDFKQSKEREIRFVNWMRAHKDQAAALIILGDLFDFWFEYKHVVPKGYLHVLGELTRWRMAGIPIYLFTGNHDLWMRDYFPNELDIPVFHAPITTTLKGHPVLLAHGDGLGPGDHGFKAMKKIFTNPLAQYLFRWIHPDIGIGLANSLSRKSRYAHAITDKVDLGEKEWLWIYAQEFSQAHPEIEWMIFGHRHFPLRKSLPNSKAEMINLGDWLHSNTYLKISEAGADLLVWKN